MARVGVVWYLEATQSGIKHSSCGGGVCIDPSGKILTNQHVVSIHGEFPPETCVISAKRYHDDCLEKKLKVVWKFQRYDLALLEVDDKDARREGPYPFVNLDVAPIQLMPLEKVFAHVHQSGSFSCKTAKTTSSVPTDIEIFDLTDKTTLESLDKETIKRFRAEALDRPPPHQTTKTLMVHDYKACSKKHPDLPFIVVDGLGGCPGASGCPVFRHSDAAFLGIATSSVNEMAGVIPHVFIQRLVVSKRNGLIVD